MIRSVLIKTSRGVIARRRLQSVLTVFLVAALLLGVPLTRGLAADGDLDPTFGHGGRVTTDFSLNDRANAVAIQADGKIIAAGSGVGGLLTLARYNADGTLDSTFGDNGKVSEAGGIAFDVVIQPDGKIITIASTGNLVMLRYNPDGSPDKSFGADGKVTANYGVSTTPQAVALQPDGRIVVAGYVFTFEFIPATNNFFSARFNPDGSADASFGTGGRVITDFSGGSDDIASDVCVQPNGKIIAAGHTVSFAVGDTTGEDFALVRYNSNGSLDGGFGSGGKVITDVAASLDFAHDAALQNDGKIVVAGAARYFVGGLDFSVVRYNPDGSLDSGFGSGGKVTTDFSGGFDEARGVAIDNKRRIVAAGFTHFSNKTSFAVTRYKIDGSLDASFGNKGLVTTDIPTEDSPDEFEAEALAVAIQRDGKIVAAGHRESHVRTGDDIALVRYLSSSFDICIKDDGSDNFLEVNLTTGDYRFTSCSGLTLSGTGVLEQRGSVITLRHNASDRRLLANINTVANKGTASIQALSQGARFAITDRNTADNTCRCE